MSKEINDSDISFTPEDNYAEKKEDEISCSANDLFSSEIMEDEALSSVGSRNVALSSQSNNEAASPEKSAGTAKKIKINGDDSFSDNEISYHDLFTQPEVHENTSSSDAVKEEDLFERQNNNFLSPSKNYTPDDCQKENCGNRFAEKHNAFDFNDKEETSKMPAHSFGGFVTGNNKTITVDPSKIEKWQHIMDDCFKGATNDTECDVTRDEDRIHKGNSEHIAQSNKVNNKVKETALPANAPARRYNCPEHGHISKANEYLLYMSEAYEEAKIYFKKMEPGWIFTQFKWAWMHLFVNPLEVVGDKKAQIFQIMKYKRDNENSILRRIVERDDIPSRYLVLGIIDYGPDWIEVYDGFYSLKAEIDVSIYTALKVANATLGSVLHVFGADLLLEDACSIFDVRCAALKFHYNGIKITSSLQKFGVSSYISFVRRISDVSMEGGPVSCLIVDVQKIVESKYVVYIDQYRNVVDNLEKELDKIQELIEKSGRIFQQNDLKVKRYTKILARDVSGECLITVWNPPEIKKDARYRFIYLNPVPKSIGVHLSTSRRSFYEEIK
ncbi:hypothetical protein ENBRE01_0677 [Enteropsectra breve]|nr:hypothetical protein ENBRE01_0677 [Enteropsectra breve]